MAQIYVRKGVNTFTRPSLFSGAVTISGAATLSGVAALSGGVTLGGATDKVTVSAAGKIALAGAATVWNKVVLGMQDLRQVSSKPDIDAAEVEFLFDKATDETCIASFKMPSDWKEASSIYPVVNWIQGAAGVVQWGLSYKIWDDGEVPPTDFTTITVAPDDTWVSGLLAVRSAFAAIAMTGMKLGANVKLLLYRDANDAADTYDADARFVSLSFDYECDALGSDSATVK